MRLLNAITLQLTEFVDNVPQYAILSHTWEEEEVVFSDLTDPDQASQKKGFKKINYTCRQAKEDGLVWVWVDTCCIDKSSSAELSEAINSMFAWYKRSRKCYAYLADVGRKEGEEEKTFKLRSSESELEHSKWFTRAWTLQELLAPSTIQEEGRTGLEFFDVQWKRLGDKISLAAKISRITGIAKEYLMGQNLGTASISMRMSWAAERRATRAEDIAYSLLGIFDVNMPLLYGEGKVKAFRRLQEEIMKISEDETLFAWESTELTASGSSGNVLANDPKDFIEARDLVPFASDDPVVPYALTHRGLRIWLQIHRYSEDIQPIRSPVLIRSPFQLHAAVLRCHVAHDFNHVVIIPLSHLTANLYIRDTTTNIGLLPTRSLPQFSPIEEVYIRNSQNPSISNSVRRRFGFLVRNLPAGFRIANANPREYWNAKDRILQGEKNSLGLLSWYASLELNASPDLSFLPPKHNISLSLGCRQERGDSEVKSWCYLDDNLWTDAEGSLHAFHESALSRPARYEVGRFRDMEGKLYNTKLNVLVSAEKVFRTTNVCGRY